MTLLSQLQEEPKPFHTNTTLSFYTHSSQDTVVALHALSKYGAVTFARSQKTPSVTIQSSGTFSRKFQIENSNRLLLQQVSLPDIPGDYNISMSGEGCVYAQVRFWGSCRYMAVGLLLPNRKSPFTYLPMLYSNWEKSIQGLSAMEVKYFYSLLIRQHWGTMFTWRKRSLHSLYGCRQYLWLVITPKATTVSRSH